MARFLRANGLRFALQTWGPEDGPLALLAHGFPDTPHTWRHLAPVLAEVGYRVVAPWMRGYGPTEAPSASRTTRDTLAADLNTLHRALGGDGRAVLVGHDWGSMAASVAAHAAPDRWRRVILVSVPPEPALVGWLADPAQVARSSYIAALGSPRSWRLVERDDHALIERLWRSWSPGYDPTEDLLHVRSSLRDRANLQAVLGYYQGLRREILTGRYPRSTGPVPSQPTLVIHGQDDGCVGVRYASRAEAVLSEGSRVETVADAGHFVHLEQPALVAALVRDHLA